MKFLSTLAGLILGGRAHRARPSAQAKARRGGPALEPLEDRQCLSGMTPGLPGVGPLAADGHVRTALVDGHARSLDGHARAAAALGDGHVRGCLGDASSRAFIEVNERTADAVFLQVGAALKQRVSPAGHLAARAVLEVNDRAADVLQAGATVKRPVGTAATPQLGRAELGKGDAGTAKASLNFTRIAQDGASPVLCLGDARLPVGGAAVKLAPAS